ncbi:MAG: nucleotidyltransferase [Caldilineaceae bacterium SB0668_bin_21]|nr:nucleotidyltransferase [Caldilineaceae bacterium SB0668_bin_21]MYC22526.1 nucleotidyltransferase [Caldilineaceae bacterium SB0662_bin_25]
MSIPESTLAKWSHHKAATAFKQAHVPIRKALEAHRSLSQFKYEVFLQGSYKNDTNLGGDSDVDVVVRLSSKLKPAVADLTGEQLQKDGSHRFVHQQWNSFRDEALKALRGRFGSAAESGRKTLKVPKGRMIPADADLVVTVSHREGIGFYLSDEQRWVVSFPQQHHSRGLKKEKAANYRFKRTIRMFKAARNHLVDKKVLARDDAPSYFIECLLYNVPDSLFKPTLVPTYTGILDWLGTARRKNFKCQNGQVELFGPGREQWSQKKARAFIKALQDMWDTWG